MAEFEELDFDRNRAEEWDESLLEALGQEIVDQVDVDLASRQDWEDQNDQWMGLAAQFLEDKNWPWPNASNVKYPLLATAALQFHSRSYPALVNESQLVQVRKTGKPSEEKSARAQRVREHMSYQILEEMEEWQEDMDRLLYILPITGLVYKKMYYSPSLSRPTAPICLAKDVIINYEATSFERAIKTHRLYMDANEVREMQNLDIYLDCDLTPPEYIKHDDAFDSATGLSPSSNQAQQVHTLYEWHGWYDFDEDGYKEPYIVTVDKDSRKVLRIVARWNEEEGPKYDEDGEILKIEPTEYFIPYKFLPNPESSIYALGFGALLGPLNAATNTVINQLIDAGTLATTQGGFLSKQIRTRGGAMRFKPGEWKQVSASGDDLRKGIFPLPVKEPSNVLFTLLGQLIQSGERLSSVQDIMVGENPGQNQPYATTMAVLEQGLKVFTGIYKRVYRSLGKEFKRLFALNGEYLNEEQYYYLFDMDKMGQEQEEVRIIARHDYNSTDLNVIPGADPTVTSDAHKILRAQSLEQKIAAGMPLNIQEVTKMSLEAEGHTNIEALMNVGPPQPDFKTQLEMQKFDHQKQYETAELLIDAQNKRFEAFKDFAQALSHLSKAQANEQSMAHNEARLLMDRLKQEHDALITEADATAKLVQVLMPQGQEGQQDTADSQPTEGNE